jgi:hypothetical protein
MVRKRQECWGRIFQAERTGSIKALTTHLLGPGELKQRQWGGEGGGW